MVVVKEYKRFGEKLYSVGFLFFYEEYVHNNQLIGLKPFIRVKDLKPQEFENLFGVLSNALNYSIKQPTKDKDITLDLKNIKKEPKN